MLNELERAIQTAGQVLGLAAVAVNSLLDELNAPHGSTGQQQPRMDLGSAGRFVSNALAPNKHRTLTDCHSMVRICFHP